MFGEQQLIDAHHHFIPRAIVEHIDEYLPSQFSVVRDGDHIHVYEGSLRHITIVPS